MIYVLKNVLNVVLVIANNVWVFMDLNPDPVAKAVDEVLSKACVLNHLSRRIINTLTCNAWFDSFERRLVRFQNSLVNDSVSFFRLTVKDCPGQVTPVTVEGASHINEDTVTLL